MPHTRWLAEYVENDAVSFRIGRRDDELLAEWIDLARLSASRDGMRVTFTANPNAWPPDVEKIRRGSARLLLRHLEGKLALHGAAVCHRGRAVILLGRSGQGKSTLAASLCGRGATLLSDDAIALEHRDDAYFVEPFESNHWLDEAARLALGHASAGDWKLGIPGRVADAPGMLVAIVALQYADSESREALSMHRVSGGLEAMALLVPQTVRFILDEPEAQRREFEQLGDLVANVPFFCLERPRDLTRLDASTAAVLTLLGDER